MDKRSLILYIEEDENDALLMRHALEDTGLGHSLKIVSNVIAAERAMGQPHASGLYPDLLVVSMASIRRFGPGWLLGRPHRICCPLVILSSFLSPADRDLCRMVDASGCFNKPAGYLELVGLLREMDARWLHKRAAAA